MRQPSQNMVSPFIELQVHKDLPVAQSRIYPIIRGDKAATKDLHKFLDGVIESKNRSVVEQEFRKAAAGMKGWINDLGYIMKLGVAKGGKLDPSNYRQAISHILLLEGLTVTPGTADMGQAAADYRSLTQAAKLGVVHQKGMPGKLFGAPGSMWKDALEPVENILGPSVGLRTNVLRKSDPVTGPLQAMFRKDIRAQQNFETGVSSKLKQLGPEERLKQLGKVLQTNMDRADYEVLVNSVENHQDPKVLASRLMDALGGVNPSTGETIEFGNRYRGLREQILKTTAGDIAGRVKPSMTRTTTKALDLGLVTKDEALKELEKQSSRMTKMLGRAPLGPAPFILGMAAILSAGLLAANIGGEDGA